MSQIAHFIRFAKDCQIISNKFSKAVLTLELAKVVSVDAHRTISPISYFIFFL